VTPIITYAQIVGFGAGMGTALGVMLFLANLVIRRAVSVLGGLLS